MITLPVVFLPQDCPAPVVDLAMVAPVWVVVVCLVVMAAMVLSPSPQSRPPEESFKRESHLSTPSERLELNLHLCPLMVLNNNHV